MSVKNPVQYVLHESDDSDNMYGSCEFSQQAAYILPVVFIIIFLLVMVCYQAWKARNLSSEFSESKYIFGMLLVMDLIVFLAWPVLFAVREIPNAMITTLAVVNFLMVGSAQLFLYLPKIIQVRQEKNGTYVKPVRLTGMAGSQPTSEIESGFVNGDRYSMGGDGGDGELILTTKTPRELLDDIQQLYGQLQQARKRCTNVEEENMTLRERLREYDVGFGDCNDDGRNNNNNNSLNNGHKGDVTADTTATVVSPSPITAFDEIQTVETSNGKDGPCQPTTALE
jgi:hypothetical protein